MDGPCDHGGIRMHLPDGGDAMRDMTGLVLAVLRGDDDGRMAILGNCDQESVLMLAAGVLAAMLMAAVRGESDPDAPPSALTAEQLDAAEAILITGIESPDDNPGPWQDGR